MIKKILLITISTFFSTMLFSQVTITGIVKDAKTNEELPGANIRVTGKALGTNSDFDGKFTLTVTENPPFTIEVSMLGYKSQTFQITQKNQNVEILLEENATSLDEVVLSASRTPERIMESPVTVERLDARAIKNTTAASFYEGLENLKGVDVNTNSLTFNSVNTRGFAGFGNPRFMQLVDGMDNSAPGLNFAVGNLLGMSDLDVATVEILPGASSALYGANAFNGIMFMRSKSAFDEQGISAAVKQGFTSQDAAGTNLYSQYDVRLAKAFSNKFAAKLSLSYLKGTEWFARDYRNTQDGFYTSGNRQSDNRFDGLNIYGDEVSTNLGGAIGVVSRTGYNEEDLIDYDTDSFKASVMFNYRPYGDDSLELIWNSKIGVGNTIFQGANRYSLQNFILHQHKLEAVGKNFFVRVYATFEDSGDSYDTRFTGININSAWSLNRTWFSEYAAAYLGSIPNVTASNHAAARAFADRNRLIPGTPEFQTALNTVTSNPDLTEGSQFKDQTSLYHADVNYNLRDVIDWAEIQVGGSYRIFSLNSDGTLFTDNDGSPINFDEFGIYTQMQKKFLEDRLKLTASLRYDKSQNFDGFFSPRISLAYAAGENKNHNFRASFQTGFRNPTTQDQYIGLNVGNAILIGSAPGNPARYNTPTAIEVSDAGQLLNGGNEGAIINGQEAYDNAFSRESVRNGNGTPTQTFTNLVAPEQVTAFELGYRGIVDIGEQKVTIDLSGYYNSYDDFISTKDVLVPLYGQAGDGSLSLLALQNDDFQPFRLYTNSEADINSYGAAIAINTKVFNDFDLGINYTYARFNFDRSTDPDFDPGFNTPQNKVKIQFGKEELFENFGFNVNLRWQDEFLWEATFLNGIVEERTVLDAQVNYTIPSIKSTLKLGGSNLTGEEYFSAPGVGAIGSIYYLSWTFNN